jgi:hypothetical protein
MTPRRATEVALAPALPTGKEDAFPQALVATDRHILVGSSSNEVGT